MLGFKVVFQLMKYIPVDSFGKCLNNARLPSSVEYEVRESAALNPYT